VGCKKRGPQKLHGQENKNKEEAWAHFREIGTTVHASTRVTKERRKRWEKWNNDSAYPV
jgi:hypothetical protein